MQLLNKHWSWWTYKNAIMYPKLPQAIYMFAIASLARMLDNSAKPWNTSNNIQITFSAKVLKNLSFYNVRAQQPEYDQGSG